MQANILIVQAKLNQQNERFLLDFSLGTACILAIRIQYSSCSIFSTFPPLFWTGKVCTENRPIAQNHFHVKWKNSFALCFVNFLPPKKNKWESNELARTFRVPAFGCLPVNYMQTFFLVIVLERGGQATKQNILALKVCVSFPGAKLCFVLFKVSQMKWTLFFIFFVQPTNKNENNRSRSGILVPQCHGFTEILLIHASYSRSEERKGPKETFKKEPCSITKNKMLKTQSLFKFVCKQNIEQLFLRMFLAFSKLFYSVLFPEEELCLKWHFIMGKTPTTYDKTVEQTDFMSFPQKKCNSEYLFLVK